MFSCFKIKIKRAIAIILICSLLTPITAKPVEATLFGLFKDTSTVPKSERTKLVSLLVEEGLMKKGFLEDRNLPEKINRYAIDIQTKLNAKVVLITVPRDASPLDIHEGNAHLYFSGVEPEGLSQLIGTVLIGDIPLPIVEKNGNFWPTIFPYVDFTDPVYEWDENKERFVFKGGNHEPEIWHGWIRADSRFGEGWDEKKLQEFKEEELISYFNDNHNYHDGTTTYDEKVFYADFPRQKEGLSEVLKERYDKWIEHIEDIAYLRYNKHWLEDVFDDSSDMSEIAWDFMDSDASPDEVPDLGELAGKIPDIHTKSVIDNFVRRYFESWKNYLSLLNTRIGNAGRWDGADIDTTISLVSTKDENSAVVLKEFNDNLESRLNTVIVANNIAEDISILEEPVGSPNYWNGVAKSDLTAEDCSLLRGSPRTTNHPFAQMVEANRSYNLSIMDPDSDTDCLAGHADCCPENISFDSSAFTMTNPDCTVADATLPIFDIAGTIETSTGSRGAEACDDLIIKPAVGGNPDADFDEDLTIMNRFDSLVYHVEPTAETLTAQLDSMSSLAMPVDDPRGFSFYDHSKTSQRIDYYNIFDLRDQYLDLSLADVSEEDMQEISGNSYGAMTQAEVDTLPSDIEAELLDNLRKKLLKERIQTDVQAKITEINDIITEGNTSSNTRLTTDRGIGFPETPAIPPEGSEDVCTYTRSTQENQDGDFTHIVLSWTEACPWREEDVIINRDYGFNDDFNEDWPGASLTPANDPPSFVGTVDCEYVREETEIDAMTTQVDRTETCIWDGTSDGVPYREEEEQSNTRYYYSKIGDFDDPSSGYLSEFRWPGTVCSKPAGYQCLIDPLDDDKCREYTLTETTPEDSTTRIEWTETCTWNNILIPLTTQVDTDSIVRYYETADSISTTIFDSLIDDAFLDDKVEALVWLDKGIAEKNQLVLEKAFSPTSDARDFFLDSSFHDGYEFIEIIGEKAEALQDQKEGIKFAFEQGQDPDNSQFKKARQESAMFSFGEDNTKKTDTGIFGKDFAKKFLGQEKAKCEGMDIIGWFPCFLAWQAELPEFLNQKLFAISGLPKLEDLNPFKKKKKSTGAKVFSPFDKNKLDEVTSLKITPAEILISGNRTDPVNITVSLLNKAGQVIESNFSTEVSLYFGTSDADRFFGIRPAQKVKTVSGKANFSLIPKPTKVGGKFSFYAETLDLKSESIPITVTRNSLFANIEKESVVAKSLEGVVISVKIQDGEGGLSLKKDDEELVFTSDWGTFSDAGHKRISNGQVEVKFYPEKRAGSAIIYVQDGKKNLPQEKLEIEILPDIPSKLEFTTNQNFLVKGAGFVPVEVYLTDKWGNPVENKTSHTLTWKGTNLEIEGMKEDQLEFQQVVSDITATVMVRPLVKSSTAKLEVTSDLKKGQGTGDEGREEIFEKNFIIPDKALLSTVVTSQEVKVGEENPIQVSLRAETLGENQINGSFEVQISTEPKDLGHFPAKVDLEEGLGQFDISAGIRAGEVKVILTSPGFEEASFDLTIQHGEPKKILISSEQNTIDVDDPHSDIIVDIKVVDEFGNIATSFINNVYLNPNEPDTFIQSDREALIDSGVFDEADQRYLALEEQAEEARALGTSPDDSLVVIEDNGKIHMKEGVGKARVTARGINTGKIFLTAKAEVEKRLIPDTLEFEITKFLTTEGVEELTPKSLVALVLGFESSDLIVDKNFANRFLHAGEVQAVGGLLTEPVPKKRLGYLTPQGEIINDLSLEINYGEFFQAKFLEENRWIATARILFQNSNDEKKNDEEIASVDFSINSKVQTDAGWYFISNQERDDEIKEEKRVLYYNMLPLFSVTERGGILVQNGGVDFRNKKGSILEWEVYFVDEKIGDFVAVLDEENAFVMTESELEGRTDGGIFIIRQSADLRIKESFVGLTTNNERGLVFISATEKEEKRKILGSPKSSAEDVQNDEEIVWNSSWKPGAFFASGNSFGEATKWGASDNFILLGDPTITVPTENTRSSLLLTPDLGKQLWKTPNGLPINQILVADINGDKNADILNLVGDELHALYQDDTATDNFRHTGPLLRFADGVRQKVIALDNDWDGFTDLIHLNNQGKLVFHKNTNGILEREKFVVEGVPDSITKVLGGNINNDDYLTDLVFADELRNLWVGFGTEDSGVFEPIYKIGNFGPHFAEVDEDFSVVDQQDADRWFFKRNDFPYLDQFLFSFDKIEDEIDEIVTPKEVIYKVQDPASDKERDNKTLLTAPYNGEIDAKLEIIPDSVVLKTGDNLSVELTLNSWRDISNFEVVIPNLTGFVMRPDTLSCDGCLAEIEGYENQDLGEMWLYGLDLKEKEKITLSWKLQAISFDNLDFLVFDFQGNDDIDDIAIPQVLDDGSQNFIQFVSSPKTNAIKKVSWLKDMTKKLTTAFLGNPSESEEGDEFMHSKQIDAFTPASVPDLEYDVESAVEPYKADYNANGIPDLYEGFGSLDLDFGCGGCGLPIPSIAFLAPGSQALYVPPYSVPLPSVPMPVFAVPTTGPLSIPFIWPGSPFGAFPMLPGSINSLFRLYVMPTTTAQVGLGICLGLQAPAMVPPLWSPNCFVMVPPLLEALGACPANGGGGSEGMISPEDLMKIAQEYATKQEGLAKKDKDGNVMRDDDGNVIREIKKDKKDRLQLPKFPNIKTSAADLIMEWQVKQYQEVDNYKLPIIKLVIPKIPFVKEFAVGIQQEEGGSVGIKAEGDLISAGGKEQSAPGDPNFLEKGLDELGLYKSPWVTVGRKEFKIPYPVIYQEELDKWEDQWEDQKEKIKEKTDKSDGEIDGKFLFKKWVKKKFNDSKEELKKRYEKLIKKEEREEFNRKEREACEDGAPEDACYLFWKETELFHDFFVSIEDNITAWEQNKISWEKNKKAFKSYKGWRKKLKVLAENLWQQIKQFKELKDIFDGYFSGWLETNKKVMVDWGIFKKEVEALWGFWNDLQDPFKKFKLKCPTCAVNRGASTEWMMRLILGAIKLPVFILPKLPNIILDFSKLSFGFAIDVPDMSLEKVELTLGDLPDFSKFFDFLDMDLIYDIDWDLESPKISALPVMPILPLMPPLPDVNFNIPVPSIALPVLPVLIGPPVIPNVLELVQNIIDTFVKKLLELFCMIVGGIAPVPEWYVAGYVQQLTNRTFLFELDFITPALSPTIEIPLDLEDIELILEANIQMPTGVFEVVNFALADIQSTAECIVNMLSEMAKGNFLVPPCSMGGQKISLDIPESYVVDITARKKQEGESYFGETETLVYDYNEDMADIELDKEDRIMVQNSIEEIENLLANLGKREELPMVEKSKLWNHLASFAKKPKVYASHLSGAWKNWRASTIDVGQIPSEIPDYLDQDQLLEDQSQYSMPLPNMYYYDGATGSVETITDFPVEGPMTHTLGDISNDGTGSDPDEILFALNDELMLKYRTVPTFSESTDENRQREMRYKENYDEEYDDRLSLIWKWDWETFKSKFMPAKEVISIVETDGNSFEFERLGDDLTYFEWTIFDRPDHIFETDLDHSKRKSLLWDRQAFLLRDKPKMYEIRPMSTRVKKIKGAPIIYMSPTEEIPVFSQEDCQNKEIVKPFFATESVLVGTEGKSRLEIRVPPRGDRPEEFEEIILREGEETIVEYAEVCLTRGKVERVSSEDIEKVAPRKNLYLPTGSRLELGLNDEVELILFDGTEIKILGNENYSLHFFSSKEKRVEHFRNLQQKNYYGEFKAFSKDGTSYHLEKFLHDPQSGDDDSVPQIKVIGGNKIKTALFQKVHIDATPTFDEQGIEKVWWDLRPEVDMDNNGDSTDDQDFPDKEITGPVRNLLKVYLPAYEEVGNYSVFLNVEDKEGNSSREEIEIEVSVPDISLFEASPRSRRVAGKIVTGQKGVPINIFRKRGERDWELLQEDSVLSASQGSFEINSLSLSGGIEIRDKEKNVVAEILPTGRPVILDERFKVRVRSASKDNPFQVEVYDNESSAQASVAVISFATKEIDVVVTDRNEEDEFIFLPIKEDDNFMGSVGLLDTETGDTLGILDEYGDFYLVPKVDITFQIKRALNEKDPLVFEIVYLGKVIGEFKLDDMVDIEKL